MRLCGTLLMFYIIIFNIYIYNTRNYIFFIINDGGIKDDNINRGCINNRSPNRFLHKTFPSLYSTSYIIQSLISIPNSIFNFIFNSIPNFIFVSIFISMLNSITKSIISNTHNLYKLPYYNLLNLHLILNII